MTTFRGASEILSAIRHRWLCSYAAMVVAAAAMWCLPPAVAQAGSEEEVARSLESVAVVETPRSVGTAFAVDQDRLVTAAHVVEDVEEVSVTIGQRRWRAEVVKTLQARDIAVLEIPGPHLTPLRWWPGEPPVGKQVLAVGAAFGQLSVTRGIVSGTRQLDGLNYLQTDAAVNPGNSGGPLLAENGRVLGLVVSKLRRAEGISLAVPAEAVRAVLRDRSDEATNPNLTADPATSVPEPDVSGSRSTGTSAWWLAAPAVAMLALAGSRAATRRRAKPAPPLVIAEADLLPEARLPGGGPDRPIVVALEKEQEQQP